MIQVIRVEHPSDGLGIWRSENEVEMTRIFLHSKYDDISERHSNMFKFPTYHRDEELQEKVDSWDIQYYNFAFLSLKQLNEALTSEELKEFINDLGFEVLMLTVTDYHTSKHQVVFKKESIIESKDISFMFI